MPRRTLGGWGAGALSLTMFLTACGSSSPDQPAGATVSSAAATVPVVASTNVYGDIARQIAGDRASVTSIISNPDADPHSYEANTRTQLALSKARVVIENGGGYDDFVDTMLKSAGNSAKVLNVVDISGKKATGGEELNEHVWYDFPAIEKLADQLAAALAEADPAGASTFTANAATFKQKVQQLEAKEASIKAAHTGAGAVVTEPVPLYMLQACGLENKTPEGFSEAIEEGTDVPANVLQETLDLFAHKEVKLLAYNEQTTGPETEKVRNAAKTNNIAVVAVTETLPDGKDYISWMSGNLSAIETALR
ncbi:MAG TPA: zinc ABC transporter substrate-binding protein [Dactylosporangium sp.]|nr:zinc ABC transporter substrate-binding protein [Dactylosporangium sp.]